MAIESGPGFSAAFRSGPAMVRPSQMGRSRIRATNKKEQGVCHSHLFRVQLLYPKEIVQGPVPPPPPPPPGGGVPGTVTSSPVGPPQRAPRPPGRYYYNVGEGTHRNWDDYKQFGFISAGQGERWRNAMLGFQPGDVVAAYLKGAGFVGIGRIKEQARPVRDSPLTASRCFLCRSAVRTCGTTPSLMNSPSTSVPSSGYAPWTGRTQSGSPRGASSRAS